MENQVPADLASWKLAILIVCVCALFGGLGGLAAHFLQAPDARAKSDEPDMVFISWWKGAFVGAMGAIGFLFFTIAVGGIASRFGNLNEILRTISTSTIAGFGARRLLPRMVDQLERQVADLSKKTAEASKEARRAEGLGERLQVNINLKEAARESASDESRRNAIEQARELIKRGEANSSTWVALARVYRWDGKLETAVSTLDDAIEAMQKSAVDDINIAAAYYNRGCYRALLHNKNTSAIEKDKALDDLDAYFVHTKNPAHKAEIIFEDEDWKSLSDDPRFREIVEKWQMTG